MIGIIDRFEEKTALIEVDGQVIEVKRAKVEGIAQEGDVVKEIDGLWMVQLKETRERSKRIKNLMNELWEE